MARRASIRCRRRSRRATPARVRPEATDRPHASSTPLRPLSRVAPSLIVELNRAVAALDGAAGRRPRCPIVDALADEPALRAYHLLPSVRGDLLARLHRFDEARAEFERAAALTGNTRERDLLARRAAETYDRSAE